MPILHLSLIEILTCIAKFFYDRLQICFYLFIPQGRRNIEPFAVSDDFFGIEFEYPVDIFALSERPFFHYKTNRIGLTRKLQAAAN